GRALFLIWLVALFRQRALQSLPLHLQLFHEFHFFQVKVRQLDLGLTPNMLLRVEGIIDAGRGIVDEDLRGSALPLSHDLAPRAPLTVAVHKSRGLTPDTIPVGKRLDVLCLRRRRVWRPLYDFHIEADFLSDYLDHHLADFDRKFFGFLLRVLRFLI